MFAVLGRHPGDVERVSTAEYLKDKPHSAPRPLHSTLDLRKLEATGFTPARWEDRLRIYPMGQ
ncbi:hypothetical protein GCM10027449_24080 [Sinomonas notoginsengisoli]